MTRQKQKSRPVISYPFWFALVIIVSCDPFEEDLLEDKDLVTFGQTEYFTVPGSTVVIDMRSVVKQSFVNATIQVSQQPAKGQLVVLDTLMLKYVPSASFVEGNDRFVVSIIRADKPIATCDIVIYMKEKVDDFPCALFAVEDSVVSEFNLTTSIKFLDNDRVCGVETENLVSSIHISPKHGHAVISGDSIIYEPESDYVGNDTLVYKITTAQNDNKNPKASFGIVNIAVKRNDPNCPFMFQDLYVLDLSDTVLESMIPSDWGPAYEIPVWEGLDVDICENVRLAMGPFLQNSGAFAFGEDGRVLFIPQLNGSSNPTAQLRLCVNDQCKNVMLKVVLGHDSFPDWEPGWSESTVTEVDEELNRIYFVNDLVGYVAGASSMYKTIDGAKTWEKLTFEVPSLYLTRGWLSELNFVNEDIGYASYGIYDQASSSSGGVMKTTNGGQSWTTVASFEDLYVYSIDFVNANLGYLAAENPWARVVNILRTTNGGVSWQEVLALGAVDAVPTVRFLNDGITGYVHYFSGIFKTDNSGETWRRCFDNTSGNTEWAIPYFALSSASGIVIASALSEVSAKSDLYRSENGADWAKVSNDFRGQIVLSPLGTLGVSYVYGEEILISVDWAQSWRKADIDPAFSNGFVSVSIPSERVAYVLAWPGKVLRFVKN